MIHQWNFDFFGTSIRISISGIHVPWDWTIFVIYCLIVVGVPAALLGKIYFDYKHYKKQQQSPQGEPVWNPLAEIPALTSSDLSSSASSSHYWPSPVEDQALKPSSTNEFMTRLRSNLALLWLSIRPPFTISPSKIVVALHRLRSRVPPTKKP